MNEKKQREDKQGTTKTPRSKGIAKKNYQPPSLVCYGKLSTLTASGTPFSNESNWPKFMQIIFRP